MTTPPNPYQARAVKSKKNFVSEGLFVSWRISCPPSWRRTVVKAAQLAVLTPFCLSANNNTSENYGGVQRGFRNDR